MTESDDSAVNSYQAIEGIKVTVDLSREDYETLGRAGAVVIENTSEEIPPRPDHVASVTVQL